VAGSTEPKITKSLSESDAFGINIGRLTVSKENRPNLDSLSFEGFDCVIIDDIDSVSPLQISQKHRELRYAGTIIYWRAEVGWLVSRRTTKTENQKNLVVADESNLDDFLDLCLDVFDGYISHYSFSPIFRSKPVNVSYADWIKRTWSNSNNILVGYEIDGKLASFALCEYSNTSVEVLLAGSGQKFRRSGAYTTLINSLVNFIPASITEFTISTQVTNTQVQRLWSSFGLTPLLTKTRYHLWVSSNTF